ncbi:MAG: hypothetical protein PVJ09_00470 [Candidatus Woesebacteria bacterium]|jgi:hypothetical protein
MIIKISKSLLKVLSLIFILCFERVIGLPFFFFLFLFIWLNSLLFKQRIILILLTSFFLAVVYQFNFSLAFFLIAGFFLLFTQSESVLQDKNFRLLFYSLISSLATAFLLQFALSLITIGQIAISILLLIFLKILNKRNFSL